MERSFFAAQNFTQKTKLTFVSQPMHDTSSSKINVKVEKRLHYLRPSWMLVVNVYELEKEKETTKGNLQRLFFRNNRTDGFIGLNFLFQQNLFSNTVLSNESAIAFTAPRIWVHYK